MIVMIISMVISIIMIITTTTAHFTLLVVVVWVFCSVGVSVTGMVTITALMSPVERN